MEADGCTRHSLNWDGTTVHIHDNCPGHSEEAAETQNEFRMTLAQDNKLDETLVIRKETTLPDGSKISVEGFVHHPDPYTYEIMGNFRVSKESPNGDSRQSMVLNGFQAGELKAILASLKV